MLPLIVSDDAVKDAVNDVGEGEEEEEVVVSLFVSLFVLVRGVRSTVMVALSRTLQSSSVRPFSRTTTAVVGDGVLVGWW